MNKYLIIDLGTGNSRVALVNETGELIDISSFENKYYKDQSYDDAQYFSPNYWQRQVMNSIKEIISKHPGIHIDAISSSGARQSSVLIDKKGDSLIGLPNIDNRGKSFMKDIANKSDIYHCTGSWVTEDCIASKIYGLKKVRSDLYDQVGTFTSLSEWIGYILTGNLCIEFSQATETLLFDLDKHDFSEELIRAFSLQDIEMPCLAKAGDKLGNLKQSVLEDLGISYDIPFIIGGADTQIALKGAGIKKGDIGIVSGTTSPVVTLAKDKYTDIDQRCWTGLYLGGEMFQVETNPGVTGLNYQRIRNLLFDKVSYDDLEFALDQVGEIKCVAFFTSLDFENARGYPTGGFFIKPPFSQDLHREDMAWAIVADIACSIFHQYSQLISMTGDRKKRILCCGGGFQSKILRQHLADLIGKKIYLPHNYHQSSVLGGVVVCNDYFNLHSNFDDSFIVVEPDIEHNLIHDYYKKWERHRNRIMTTREDV